jgi:hypothetical protein
VNGNLPSHMSGNLPPHMILSYARWKNICDNLSFTNAGSEVLTAVVMKSYIFWVITPCNLLKIFGFGRICHFHLQGRKIIQARNQHKAGSKQRVFNGLHGVTSQKREFSANAICITELYPISNNKETEQCSQDSRIGNFGR